MELEKISISGISDVYAVSAIKKEFKKAVNQPWKNSEPYPEYQKKLLADLAVLDIARGKIESLSSSIFNNGKIVIPFVNVIDYYKATISS